jgi:hypothetical protein
LHSALCAWEAKLGRPPAIPEVRRKAAALAGAIRGTVLSRAATMDRSKVATVVLYALLVAALLAGLVTVIRDRSPELPAPPPVDTTHVSRPAAAPDLKTVTVDTVDGTAQVLVAGKPAGTTPFRVQARTGERIELVLRRAGCKDLPVQFDVTERHDYTYTLQRLKEY